MNKAGKIIEKMLSDPNQRTDLIKFHKAVEKYNSEKPRLTKQLRFEHFLRDNSKDGIEFRLVVTKKELCEFALIVIEGTIKNIERKYKK